MHRTEPTGEMREITVSEWWCHDVECWTFCPGPCTDGKPHRHERQRTVLAKVHRRVQRNDESQADG